MGGVKAWFWLLVLFVLAVLVSLLAWGSALLPSPRHLTPTPTALPERWTTGQLEIHVLAVQHGDAQLVISPSGETMLIDCARVQFAQKVADYLRAVLGKVTVDYLLLSHYHPDHDGACAPLFRKHKLAVRRAVLDRGGGRQEYDSDSYRAYYDVVTDPANKLTRVRVHVGDLINMGPGISLQVLSVGDIDTRTALGVPVVGENDNSIALWLTFGRFDYWTGADLSGVNSSDYANIEAAVIPRLPRQADVYHANHHGSNNNSHPAFLAALNPTVSLVSTNYDVVGWDTILRLEKYGDVYITEKIPAHKAYGDIVVTSTDGETYTVEGKRYASK